MPLSTVVSVGSDPVLDHAPGGRTDQTHAEIAQHTRQLAVSLLARPVRAERAKVLVELVLDDVELGPSTYSERLLASVFVDVHLQLGDRESAQALCNRIDLCTGSSPSDMLIAARVAAAVSLFDAEKSHSGSLEGLLELVCRLEVLAADTSGDTLERARAALLVGRVWARLGRDRAAAAWLESAAVLFDRAGQPQWSRITREEVSTVPVTNGELDQPVRIGYQMSRRIEVAGQPSPAAVPQHLIGAPTSDGAPHGSATRLERPFSQGTDDWQVGLTPAERRVALLIGGGRSNREAAAELFVSVKTVESHVQSVFRKLGMHRRSELANLVGRTLAA